MPSRSIVSRAARAVGTTCSPSCSSSMSTCVAIASSSGTTSSCAHGRARSALSSVRSAAGRSCRSRRGAGRPASRARRRSGRPRAPRSRAASPRSRPHDPARRCRAARCARRCRSAAVPGAKLTIAQRTRPGCSWTPATAVFHAFWSRRSRPGWRFVGFGAMSSGKHRNRRGGHPAKQAARRERDRARREAPADPLRRAAATLCREAATLEDALDAELWASALLGSWWPPQPGLASGDSDVEIGAPLASEVARLGRPGAVAALLALGAVSESELGLLALEFVNDLLRPATQAHMGSGDPRGASPAHGRRARGHLR